MASAGGERHRLQDPARALRLAIRNYDEPKVARLTDWLLNGVPLQWDEQFPLARCRVIRGRVARATTASPLHSTRPPASSPR